MNNWKICRFCVRYNETMEPHYEDGGIFPGKGECFLEPPTLELIEGHRESMRPEVHATDDCGEFDLDSLKIDLWLEYLDKLEKDERDIELRGPDTPICSCSDIDDAPPDAFCPVHGVAVAQTGHYVGLDAPVNKGAILDAQAAKRKGGDGGETDSK